MSELYPFKFKPRLKERIWGGYDLVRRYNKKADPEVKYGESWEISAVSGDLSVVSNGFLEGNNIEEIIEVYMGDITGDTIYDKFGIEFPLLIKIIEAHDDLSVQVHPDNRLAKERHSAYGKTEMWYILKSEDDSKIFTGFREPIDRETYLDALKSNTLIDLLNTEKSSPGDIFFTPAGRIHAIGAGNTLIEIQQTSDITYRIFDWNRKDKNGKSRELHTDLALDAIDFKAAGQNKFTIDPPLNRTQNLIKCEFFITNVIHFNKRIIKDYNLIDSFIIFICLEGEFLIRWEDEAEHVELGETVLLPAMIKEISLEPVREAKLLEIFINLEKNNYPNN